MVQSSSGAEDLVVGWKAIAEDLGLSVWKAKMMFRRAGVQLPKLALRGRTSPVYMVRTQLLRVVLRLGIRASRGR